MQENLHWKLTLGEKPLPHMGLEPASVLRLVFQSDALPIELSQRLACDMILYVLRCELVHAVAATLY